MGREIRRVPPNWKHPMDDSGRYRPTFNKDYETAAKDWIEGLLKWEAGEDPGREKTSSRYYWDWVGNPPSENYQRPAFTEEPTHYQIYETVSEGTPVSPVFANLDKMEEWLVQNGHSENAAARFVKFEWAPSMIFSPTKGVSGIGIHSLDWLESEKE